MSLVCKAWCPRRQTTVALKTVRPGLIGQDAVLGLLRRDAWFAGRLRHSHIVLVYETGEANGCPYVVMQYCPGGSLADRLRMRTAGLAWPHAFSVVQQVGSALRYAHARGVVHGDVKPGNVLFDEDGRALLSDFGIAQLVGRTALGGTPGFAAPEQVRGYVVDSRADVYALAAVLVAMLAGRQRPLTPDARVTTLSLNAPSGIESVLSEAMAPDPARRVASVRDFLWALARL
jgi:serine/threonine protein kinase